MKKKCAGILIESSVHQNSCEFIILGIGVNLISNPDNTIFPAGNLSDFNINISKEEFLQNFLDEFDKIYQNYLNFGFKNIRNLWLKNAYKLGKEITIDNQLGIFKDLDDQGNLILQTDNHLQKISFGDVV